MMWSLAVVLTGLGASTASGSAAPGLRGRAGTGAKIVKVVEPPYRHHPLHTLFRRFDPEAPPYHPPDDGMTKFVIISWPRSTTNSLVSALNTNDNIDCQFEAFSQDAVYTNDWLNVSVAQRDSNRSSFMRRMFETKNPAKPHQQAAGFKIFHNQVSRREYDALVEPTHVKKIVIERSDLLSTYVSHQLGHHTGSWDRSDEDIDARLELHVHLDGYDEYKKLHDAWFEIAKKKAEDHPSSWLFLSSEELTNSVGLRKIYHHLGVKDGAQLEYNPYQSSRLSHRISNYKEVAEALNLPPELPPLRQSTSQKAEFLIRRAFYEYLLWLILLPVLMGNVYPTHRLVNLIRLAVRSRPERPTGRIPVGCEPHVTIQICCYNEAEVISATIDAACSVDWPSDKLYVEILDDSSDETSDIVAKRCSYWQAQGINAVRKTRPDRIGYKAGNLQYHHLRLRTDFVAIFDADHRPQPDVLRRAMPYFFDRSVKEPNRVALVQMPWGYYNKGTNVLTQCDALNLDTFFVVEQRVRPLTFDFLSFNGTGGIWRREAIDAGGGWAWDTVTEDLDISYRTYLQGYKMRFLPDIVQDLEVPASVLPYKSQKHRWTKGYAQVTMKSLGFFMRSSMSLTAKIEVALQLTGPLQYVATLWLVLWTPILHYYRLFTVSANAVAMYPIAVYAVIALVTAIKKPTNSLADSAMSKRLRRTMYVFPACCIAIGQSVQETFSWIEGMVSSDATFVRTQKDGGKKTKDKELPVRMDRAPTAEEIRFRSVRSPKAKSFFSDPLFNECIAFEASCVDYVSRCNAASCQSCGIKSVTLMAELLMLFYIILWSAFLFTDEDSQFDSRGSLILYVMFATACITGFSWMALGSMFATLSALFSCSS